MSVLLSVGYGYTEFFNTFEEALEQVHMLLVLLPSIDMGKSELRSKSFTR